ncbi:MAG TPA: class I SAM-dependent methyltransferase [Thermoanaerobaculia bacterium]
MTDRKASEQLFYDEAYLRNAAPALNGFYELSSGVRDYHQRVLATAAGKRVLEYGCGMGGCAFDLAAKGALVTGIDISASAIERATERAKGYPPGSLTFQKADAEALPFADASFDVVCGSGILHHLDLARAVAEVRRVVKPGGRAIFYEPLAYHPAARLYRVLTPGSHTPDEHPLTRDDLARLQTELGGRVAFEFYDCLAVGAIPFLRLPAGTRLLRLTERLDRGLFRRLPAARHWAAAIVIDATAEAA